MTEPTALDVAKELGALAGKTIIYTACIGAYLFFAYWLSGGLIEAWRIMK